ncbi:hypothetical protein GOP47_0024013 [Adiantum capillus-veneris]|uniref:Uncharacterized protein n=1 Tax=Adiantum capillus-veneris TaxID=13818 RepID=A0A9D4Z3W9_ADICA|nr:hypothetical protein GOP47_0024013 [Adiantum capillus-veneris]
MNKFNLPRRSLLKDRRAKRATLRRLKSGHTSLKIPTVRAQRPSSGKKQRKQLKKWRRAQKEAIESGLVSLQDIEMMAVDTADGQSQVQEEHKKPYKVHLKKKAKLILRKSKKQGKDANSNGDKHLHLSAGKQLVDVCLTVVERLKPLHSLLASIVEAAGEDICKVEMTFGI